MFPGNFKPPDATFHTLRRMFVKTNGAPTGTAYGWKLQYQNAAGVFSDHPSGIAGTTTDYPLYMADGSTTVPTGTICEAVDYTGGLHVGLPIQGRYGNAGPHGEYSVLSGNKSFVATLTVSFSFADAGHM